MGKKQRIITALCLAALLGCLVPVGTMKAAEDAFSEIGASISVSVVYYRDDGTAMKAEDLSINENLGREIDYVHIDRQDKILNISAEFLTPSEEAARSLYFYLDTNGGDTSLSYEDLDSIDTGWVEFYGDYNISLDQDGKYVLYFKVKQDEKAYYAVSQGVVATSVTPDVVIEKSGDYSLESGKEYRLGDGSYMVKGDTTVYRSGSTFYVKESGTYTFTKY